MSNKKYCILLQASLRLYCWVWYISLISLNEEIIFWIFLFSLLCGWVSEASNCRWGLGCYEWWLVGKAGALLQSFGVDAPRVAHVLSAYLPIQFTLGTFFYVSYSIIQIPNSLFGLWEFLPCASPHQHPTFILYIFFYQNKYFIWHKRNCTS